LSLPTALVLIFFIFYKKANLAFSAKNKLCNLFALDSMANGAHAIYGIEKGAVSINFHFGTEYLAT
jgi:hypothetical protein